MGALIGSWLVGKASQYGLVILKYLAIAGIVLAAFMAIKRAGRLEQKVKDYETGIKGIQQRSKIEREIKRAADPELDRWL